jgi:hypothetical protein
MTRRKGKGERADLVLDLGPILQEQLDAAARSLARIAVDKALKSLGLDSGSTIGDNVGNLHKAAPAGVDAPTGAKEQVT